MIAISLCQSPGKLDGCARSSATDLGGIRAIFRLRIEEFSTTDRPARPSRNQIAHLYNLRAAQRNRTLVERRHTEDRSAQHAAARG